VDADALVRTSRLTARIDNNAIADGFQLYLHSFVVTRAGEWAIVQQGMNEGMRWIWRRIHSSVRSPSASESRLTRITGSADRKGQVATPAAPGRPQVLITGHRASSAA
jgi:hypothetical protein